MARPSFSMQGETRWKRLLLTGGALVSAVIVITGPIASAAYKVDDRYVKQHAYDSVRIVQQGTRAIDSLKHEHELEQINQRLARMDTSTMCLRRRKPSWCE